MEHRKALTPSITTIDSSNNNKSHNRNRQKKRTAKRQQLASSSLTSNTQHISTIFITDSNRNHKKMDIHEQQERIPIKNPLGWRKKWTKWFSSCGSDRISHTDSSPIPVTIGVSEYLFIYFPMDTLKPHLLCD
jgi:hypothetical protein